jgi:hypothetical protein
MHLEVGRIGDNHQIFPVDGHRVASAGRDVNAYSVNSQSLDAVFLRGILVLECRLTLAGKARRLKVCGQAPASSIPTES